MNRCDGCGDFRQAVRGRWHGTSDTGQPTVSNLAKGLDRTLVLGGGGEYYVAWYCGFFHGLLEDGVDLNIAEMVVGTSAGAYAGSSLTSGEFHSSPSGV